MAFSFAKFIKGLVIREENTNTPKEIEITPGGSAGTKTSIVSSQTANRTVTLPDATTTVVGHDATQTLTNKTIDADLNTISNIENTEIKAGAAIDATKLGNGDVDNTELSRLNGILSSAVGISDTQTLTNKTIDADLNTLSNIENADIKALAAIDATKIADGSVSNTEFQQLNGILSAAVGISDTQTLTNKTIDADLNTLSNIENADIKALAAIDATKIANGTISNTEFQQLNGVTSSVVGVSDTQTLSNKSFSDAVVLAEIATPATPSAGNGKIYFKNDGFLYQLNDDGSESKVGAGSGGINYILNPDAESNTNGWVTYADSGSRPTDGTGGSPNVTFTRSTSSPLRNNANFLFTKDAANRQGEGVSYDFTIARADQAKVLQISFDYEIGSGTYSGGTSSTDSDLIAYIYDVTNAQLIEPAPFKLDGGVVGTQYQFKANFQTNSNSTSYRLILHVATTSASAFTVKMDNVIVGPQVTAQGGVVTDFAPLIGASASMTTNTTTSIFGRKVGGILEVRGRLAFSGAPNNVPLTVTIPYTIDTASLGADKDSLGTAHFIDAGTDNAPGKVVYNNTTSVSIYALGASGTFVNSGDIGNTVPFTYGAGDSINFEFAVPILGWGTSQTLSQDTATRVVAARMNGSSFTSTANVNSKATFSTVLSDSHGALSSSTFTAPVPGYYDVSANLTFNAASWTSGQRLILYYRIDSTDYEINRKTITVTTSQIVEVSGSALGIKLNAGQTVEIRVLGEVAVTSVDGNFGVAMRSGPSQIAATENILMSYSRSTTQTISTNTVTTLIWTDKFKDTHGMMNTSTGVATIRSPGDYDLFTIVEIDQNATGRRQLSIKKNGVDYRNLENATGSGAGASNQLLQGSTVLENLKTGDTIEIYLFHDSGANRTAFPNGTGWSFFQLARRSGV